MWSPKCAWLKNELERKPRSSNELERNPSSSNELERKAPATLEQPKHGDEEDQQEQEIVEDAEA
jgi:hypothetical protein